MRKVVTLRGTVACFVIGNYTVVCCNTFVKLGDELPMFSSFRFVRMAMSRSQVEFSPMTTQLIDERVRHWGESGGLVGRCFAVVCGLASWVGLVALADSMVGDPPPPPGYTPGTTPR